MLLLGRFIVKSPSSRVMHQTVMTCQDTGLTYTHSISYLSTVVWSETDDIFFWNEGNILFTRKLNTYCHATSPKLEDFSLTFNGIPALVFWSWTLFFFHNILFAFISYLLESWLFARLLVVLSYWQSHLWVQRKTLVINPVIYI